MAGDGQVVAVVQDVGGRGVDPEVGLTHMAKSLWPFYNNHNVIFPKKGALLDTPVVRHAAHPGSSVGPVIADTVIGGQVSTQPLTLSDAAHTLLIPTLTHCIFRRLENCLNIQEMRKVCMCEYHP